MRVRDGMHVLLATQAGQRLAADVQARLSHIVVGAKALQMRRAEVLQRSLAAVLSTDVLARVAVVTEEW